MANGAKEAEHQDAMIHVAHFEGELRCEDRSRQFDGR